MSEIWEHKEGKRPYTLVAYEREDRGYEVYFRWQVYVPSTEEGKPGKSQPVRIATGLRIRDERGRPRKSLKDEAIKAVKRAQEVYAAGGDPRNWNIGDAGVVPTTVEEGFRTSLINPKNPEHAGTFHAHIDANTVDQRRSADHMLRFLAPGQEWRSLTQGRIQTAWKTWAAKYVESRSELEGWARAGKDPPKGYRRVPGHRTAEKAVQILSTVSDHLVSLHGREAFPGVAMPNLWQQALKADWERITGEKVDLAKRLKQKRLRYSDDELRRIWEHLPAVHAVSLKRGGRNVKVVDVVRPMLDPRVRTLIEIGAEARHGQVERLRRRDVHLDETGGFGSGQIMLAQHGSQKKLASDIDINPDMREYLEWVLEDGYLSELEASYQRGELEDYPIFPAGRFRGGKATVEQVRANLKPITHSYAIKLWHKFERAAGVEQMLNRGFYGLRRSLADWASRYSKSDRAKNQLTGHASTKTREGIYMDVDEEDRAEAAVVRQQVRRGLAGEEPAPQTAEGAPSVASLFEQMERLSEEDRAKLLSLLRPS